MRVTLRERSFGELLQQTFSLTAAHFVPLLLLVGVFSVPQLVGQLLLPGDTGRASVSQSLTALAVMLVGMILWPVAQGAAIFVVAGSFTGQEMSLGDALRRGLRKGLPLLAFGFAYGLAVGLGSLLIVPGIILAVMFFVAPPAIVIEDLRWSDGFGRSRQLTEGHRWTVFGLLLILMLAVFGLPAFAMGAVVAAMNLPEEGTAFVLGSWGISVLVSTFLTVAPVVVYFNLRVIKERFDVEQLAALVDVIGEHQQAR